jgi:hypothetical protein
MTRHEATEILADLEAQVRRETGELRESGVPADEARREVESRYAAGLRKWRKLAE